MLLIISRWWLLCGRAISRNYLLRNVERAVYDVLRMFEISKSNLRGKFIAINFQRGEKKKFHKIHQRVFLFNHRTPFTYFKFFAARVSLGASSFTHLLMRRSALDASLYAQLVNQLAEVGHILGLSWPSSGTRQAFDRRRWWNVRLPAAETPQKLKINKTTSQSVSFYFRKICNL